MTIPPPKKIIEEAFIKNYEEIYQLSIADPEGFWEEVAQELLWFKPWKKVLQWQYPYARWFVGGETNIIYNALDRWQKTPVAEKLALIWVGQDMTERKFTYRQLNEEVSRFANLLKTLGVRKGDRITIYLPRIPEQFIAMLAAVKIGAIHSVVYSGFSTEALRTRIEDAQPKIVITCDWYPYKEKKLTPLDNVKEAIKGIEGIKKIIVVKRDFQTLTSPITPPDERFIFWDEASKTQDTICPTTIMEATEPSFILYTSGTTGKPKGVVHSHGGYMVGVYATTKYIFNLHFPRTEEIFWSTADAGWITGHSYILYGPLLNGATTFVYEGTPDYPDIEIWWRLIDRFKITHFYTAPTAIRMLMRHGEAPLKKYAFSSLKILGSVGEPINPEAWLWFYKNVGHEQCPIMDTWWQTETGMIMISPFPTSVQKPGSCFKPFFGVVADIVDENGQTLIGNNKIDPNKKGYLVIKTPWPAMLLDLWQNPKRYLETYFEKIPNPKHQIPKVTGVSSKGSQQRAEFFQPAAGSSTGGNNEKQDPSLRFDNFLYFTGDSAKIDEDGYFHIVGRNDDVIKVAGHRLGSAELESAFVAHAAVAEAAVIGLPDEVKGERIKAFVILKINFQPTDALKQELKQQVRQLIGPIATPDEIEFVEKLPKTRSGKIMRRVLKAKELGEPVGDVSTLESD
jgi:acetyl-CoA synthetase